MSQQLYIFGRPVSASNDNELGGPPDETRSPMATAYQRPQPPLNFGSDTLSFTDPRRYETKSQPQRTNEPNRLAFSDTSRGTRHESIPPVSQLLTPGSQPSIPPSPFSPQYTPELQRQSSLRSSHKDQTSERLPQIPGHPYQGMYQHSQPPAQVQDHGIVIQRRDNYQSSPPFHFDPKSHGQNQSPNVVPYAAYPPRDTQVPYAPQPQIARAVPLDVPQQYPHQQLAAVNTSNQTQQTYPMRTPGQYYQDILGNRPLSIDPGLGPERGESNSTNVIKPQPRVVSDALVPGEGPVWVYEDGTTCPKVVDGELVNANWGITKAGKPRKRLAMACTTCREKKIKCDPAEPKCVQCEKFGRECRFSTAPRNQRLSPESPSYEFQACAQPITIKNEPGDPVTPSSVKCSQAEDLITIKRRNNSPEMSQLQTLPENATPALSSRPPVKKSRSNDLPTSSIQTDGKDYLPRLEEISEEHPPTIQILKTPQDDLVRFHWNNDPYDADALVTTHYIELYFNHVNTASHRIFPRGPFSRWLEAERCKSPDDLMLIYSMMALGTTFSLKPDRKAKGSLFSQIGRIAVDKSQSKYSLQLAQSRILLALYHFASGDSAVAWDFVGMGMRATLGLKLNLEEECKDVRECDSLEYGLNRNALSECRRRTYWSAYIIDRFTGSNSGYVCMLHSEDTFLRLPCGEEAYERQQPTDTPHFDNGLIDSALCQAHILSKLGPMAYLVQLSSIWGDLVAQIYRSSRQSADLYHANYESFYTVTYQRLLSWQKGLPPELIYTPSNASRAMASGSIGNFLKLHTLYHATIMKLNRNVRHACLAHSFITRNIKEARSHAWQVLKMMRDLNNLGYVNTPETSTTSPILSTPDLRNVCSSLSGSTPFAGYAILMATDILSAGGPFDPKSFTNTLERLSVGREVVEELSQCWASAANQRKAIRKRIEKLITAAAVECMEKKAWRCTRALETALGAGQDLSTTIMVEKQTFCLTIWN